MDGVTVGRMAIEDTVLMEHLPEVEYSVGLSGIATGCDVGGGNPRGTRVVGDRTTRAIFLVKCDPAATGPRATS